MLAEVRTRKTESSEHLHIASALTNSATVRLVVDNSPTKKLQISQRLGYRATDCASFNYWPHSYSLGSAAASSISISYEQHY